MGFLARVKHVLSPRANNSGGLWDNTNTPGGVGFSAPVGRLPIVRPPGVTLNNVALPLPNPEYYLRGTNVVRSDRMHSQPDSLLPQIPVREPSSGIGFGFSYDTGSTPPTANPTVLSSTDAPGKQRKAVSPSQIRARELEYDAANFTTLQKGVFAGTASTRYFAQAVQLPEFTVPSVKAHGVQCLLPELKRGWEQALVPEPGMRFDEVGTAPPTLLSTPLNVRTIIRGGDGHRRPITKVQAPKRVRSGG